MRERRDTVESTAAAAEAAQWFILLKDTRLGRARKQEYVKWLQASPEHMAEALRMGRLYGLLRHSQLERCIIPERSNVVRLDVGDGSDGAGADGLRTPWYRRPWTLGVAAPAIVLLAMIVGGSLLGRFEGTIETAASEWRYLTLADGSLVRAGPHTRLNVALRPERRDLELAKGEAYFQVAKDPARPFLVHAGQAVMRAVGTEFGVSRLDGRVLVTVAEGAVAISHAPARFPWLREGAARRIDPAQDKDSVAVTAGEQAAVPRQGPVTVQRVNVAQELAWAQGRLIFDDKSVAEAIAELNRRNRIQIVLDDRALAGRAVRGVFDAADPESFAQFLASVAPVHVVRDGRDVLRVKPAQSGRFPRNPARLEQRRDSGLVIDEHALPAEIDSPGTGARIP